MDAGGGVWGWVAAGRRLLAGGCWRAVPRKLLRSTQQRPSPSPRLQRIPGWPSQRRLDLGLPGGQADLQLGHLHTHSRAHTRTWHSNAHRHHSACTSREVATLQAMDSVRVCVWGGVVESLLPSLGSPPVVPQGHPGWAIFHMDTEAFLQVRLCGVCVCVLGRGERGAPGGGAVDGWVMVGDWLRAWA